MRECTNNNNINPDSKDFNKVLEERFKTKDMETITHAILNEANLISG
jgi:hypothetical protein